MLKQFGRPNEPVTELRSWLDERWTARSADARAGSGKEHDPIPESFSSIEEAAEFWDTHSSADYDDVMREVKFEVDIKERAFLVSIEGNLADDLKMRARHEGLRLEALVNLWLRERCAQPAG